jgi:ABC-type histidine transport system ATPase subunit
MIFQSFNLFPHLTAMENCTLVPTSSLGTEMVGEVLDLMVEGPLRVMSERLAA